VFGRNKGAAATVAEKTRSVAQYVDPLVRDDKLRRKLATALAVGNDARRRAKRQTGLTGLARRLATDPVLRSQLDELSRQLKGMQKRAKKTRSHKLRNTLLVVTGLGIAGAAAWKLLGSDDSFESWEQPSQQQDGVQVFSDEPQPSSP
jgi:hypothetical protein